MNGWLAVVPCLIFAVVGFFIGWEAKGYSVERAEYHAEETRDGDLSA